MRLDFRKDGEAVADHKCWDYILDKYNKGDDISISSENIPLTARAMIRREVLDKDKVEFMFEGESIGYADNNGKLPSYPIGYCEHMDNMLNILIGLT